MAANGDAEKAFVQNLSHLTRSDPNIENIVVQSKFVVAYLLQQDGSNPGWIKADIEGPVYLVKRRVAPYFQLMVKNQFSQHGLLDDLHPDWELDCQNNYVFYKVEDPSKSIRGLWFHDDNERQRIEAAVEKTLQEIRQGSTQEPQIEPPSMQAPPAGPIDEVPLEWAYAPKVQVAAPQIAPAQQAEDVVTVSHASLAASLKSLADDPQFLNMLMSKLRDQQRRSA
mmetsp:Transcript_29298/g.88658  ORF Transcript_29298/g.88658 Transcript_29298/m.88658 type:complete len:225 (-) Transcript_29298:193-867(-)